VTTLKGLTFSDLYCRAADAFRWDGWELLPFHLGYTFMQAALWEMGACPGAFNVTWMDPGAANSTGTWIISRPGLWKKILQWFAPQNIWNAI
jgi:hypothetical protein